MGDQGKKLAKVSEKSSGSSKDGAPSPSNDHREPKDSRPPKRKSEEPSASKTPKIPRCNRLEFPPLQSALSLSGIGSGLYTPASSTSHTSVVTSRYPSSLIPPFSGPPFQSEHLIPTPPPYAPSVSQLLATLRTPATSPDLFASPDPPSPPLGPSSAPIPSAVVPSPSSSGDSIPNNAISALTQLVPVLSSLLAQAAPLLSANSHALGSSEPEIASLPGPSHAPPPVAPSASVPPVPSPPAAPPAPSSSSAQLSLTALLAGLNPSLPTGPSGSQSSVASVPPATSESTSPPAPVVICSPVNSLNPGDNLPERIREKIRTNKYVDFHEICYPDKGSFELAFSLGGTGPNLQMAPSKRDPLTQQEWAKAFYAFMGVYLREFPDKSHELLAYGSRIRELMGIGANWRLYDTTFRKERELRPCPWNAWNAELYTKAVASPPARSDSSSKDSRKFRPRPSKSHSKSGVPVNYCWEYHTEGTYCKHSPCRYKHVCPTCAAPHPMYRHGSSTNKAPQRGKGTPKKPTADPDSPKTSK